MNRIARERSRIRCGIRLATSAPNCAPIPEAIAVVAIIVAIGSMNQY